MLIWIVSNFENIWDHIKRSHHFRLTNVTGCTMTKMLMVQRGTLQNLWLEIGRFAIALSANQQQQCFRNKTFVISKMLSPPNWLNWCRKTSGLQSLWRLPSSCIVTLQLASCCINYWIRRTCAAHPTTRIPNSSSSSSCSSQKQSSANISETESAIIDPLVSYGLSAQRAWSTLSSRPEGLKAGPKGLNLEVGPWRGP